MSQTLRALPPLLPMLCAIHCSADVVYEPPCAHYSLGMILWHMGHRADMIERFREFLDERGLGLADLQESAVPDAAISVLVEPQLLPEAELSGWVAG